MRKSNTKKLRELREKLMHTETNKDKSSIRITGTLAKAERNITPEIFPEMMAELIESTHP